MERKAINKEGRHVGLDFYDLLIEGHYLYCYREQPVWWSGFRVRRIFLRLEGAGHGTIESKSSHSDDIIRESGDLLNFGPIRW